MALPSTVTGDIGNEHHHSPPLTSGGSFYCVFVAGSFLTVRKADSDDPTGTWTSQDSGNGPTNLAGSNWSVRQDGTILRIVTSAADEYQYHTFDMSDDTWGTVEEVIFAFTSMDESNFPHADIVVRAESGDEIVVVLQGDVESDMGTNAERVDIWHKAVGATSWTGPISADEAVAQDHYTTPTIVLGTNDNIHLSYTLTDNSSPSTGQFQQKTIRNDNTLSTVIVANTVNPVPLAGGAQSNIISYDDGGTQRVRVLTGLTSSQTQAARTKENSSTEDIETDGQGGGNLPDDIDVDTYKTCTLANHGTDLYCIYVGGGVGGNDQDLFVSISTNGGASWGTETLIRAGTFGVVSGQIYERAGNIVFAFMYKDIGDTSIRYDELFIESAGGDDHNQEAKDSDHLHTADRAHLSQDHKTHARNTAHLHDADAAHVELFVPAAIPADATHLHVADRAHLSQDHKTHARDADHLHDADRATLTQNHCLKAADADHLHTADAAHASQIHDLKIAEATHLHTAERAFAGIAELFSNLDETTASDDDLISSKADPTTADFYEGHIKAITDPINHLSHVIKTRLRKTGAGTLSCNVDLYQGAIQIASLVAGNLNSFFTQYELNLSTAEMEAITDYSDLRFRVIPNTVSGSGAVDCSWLELSMPYVPDAALGSDAVHLHVADKATIVHNVPITSVESKDADHLHTADAAHLSQVHSLKVSSADHLHIAEGTKLGVVILTQDADHLHTADRAHLSQEQKTHARDSDHLHTPDAAHLSQVHSLKVESANHLHTADAAHAQLIVSVESKSADHLHTADAAHISQIHDLKIDEATHLHTADNPRAAPSQILVNSKDADHLHTADRANLGQVHSLKVESADHLHDAEGAKLGVVVLTQDAAHDHTADAAHVSQVHSLKSEDATHLHTADAATLTQLHSLKSEDATHLHTAEEIHVSQVHSLKIESTDHIHTADNASLLQVHALKVSQADHLHTADAAHVSQIHSLKIMETVHLHTANRGALSQWTIVNVKSSDHLHTAAALHVDILKHGNVIADITEGGWT